MRILIVEDEKKLADSLTRGFKSENYQVDVVYDGQIGLDYAKRNEYDAIILDLMLPRVNGLDLLQNLRKNNIMYPVIILTAKNTVGDKITGLNEGADDYLGKPFSFEELLARVRSIIRRSKSSNNYLEVDNLMLDPRTYKVMRAGKEVTLSAKEFALLEYLMYHKGATIATNQIIDHLWDNNSFISSNVLAAQIKNLRVKIDKAFPNDKPLIKTVRGIGYKIINH